MKFQIALFVSVLVAIPLALWKLEVGCKREYGGYSCKDEECECRHSGGSVVR
jgi:hypothetical protein